MFLVLENVSYRMSLYVLSWLPRSISRAREKSGGNRKGSTHSPSSFSLLWMEKEEERKEGERRKASLSFLMFLFSSKREKSEIAPLGNARPAVVLHSPRIFITEQTNFCLK